MSGEMNRSRRSNPMSHLVMGILIATLGVLFMLENMHVLRVDVWRYWPLALILVGIVHMTQSKAAGGWIGGAIWIAIGSVLLGNRLGYFHLSLWNLWPLAMVLIGVRMVLQSRDARAGGSGDLDDGSMVSAISILGGVDRKITSQEFRRAEITAFMGGGKLDLRDAKPAGGQAVVNVLAVMGGFELLVPPNWTVTLEVMPFMGGADDKRRVPAAIDPEAPKLFVRGFVMMGGVEIKD